MFEINNYNMKYVILITKILYFDKFNNLLIFLIKKVLKLFL